MSQHLESARLYSVSHSSRLIESAPQLNPLPPPPSSSSFNPSTLFVDQLCCWRRCRGHRESFDSHPKTTEHRKKDHNKHTQVVEVAFVCFWPLSVYTRSLARDDCVGALVARLSCARYLYSQWMLHTTKQAEKLTESVAVCCLCPIPKVNWRKEKKAKQMLAVCKHARSAHMPHCDTLNGLKHNMYTSFCARVCVVFLRRGCFSLAPMWRAHVPVYFSRPICF